MDVHVHGCLIMFYYYYSLVILVCVSGGSGKGHQSVVLIYQELVVLQMYYQEYVKYLPETIKRERDHNKETTQ